MSNATQHDEEDGTHIDSDDGLWIPEEFRDFDEKLVIRTPSVTIEHNANFPIGEYYPLIDASHFGETDELDNPNNPDLAPDRVRLKLAGEPPAEFRVEQ